MLAVGVLFCACPSETPDGDAGVALDTGPGGGGAMDGGVDPADTGVAPDGDAGGGDAVDGGGDPVDGGLVEDAGAVVVDAGPVEGTQMSGTVRDFQSQVGVPGVRVCVYEQPEFPCTTSDQDGAYSLIVPPGELVMIFDQGENPVIPQLMPLIIGEAPFGWNQIVINQQASGMMFQLWGQENDPTKGSVAVTSFVAPRESDGLQGAVAAIDPVRGAGPFYTANGFPSAGASVTDTNGLAAFLNVDPGEGFTATVTKEGWTCEVPSDREPNSFPVVAGHLTSVTRRCTE